MFGWFVLVSLVDFEDDLMLVRYVGDFGSGIIIVILFYDVVSFGVGNFGYSLIEVVELLFYVQLQLGWQVLVGFVGIDMDDDEWVCVVGWCGIQNFGLLILWVGLGVVFIVYGLQKLFGWWDGQGLVGFQNLLFDIGYQYVEIFVYVSVGGEIVVGVLLVLGLFILLVVVGVLVFLINGLFVGILVQYLWFVVYFLQDGYEYQIILVVMVVVVILSGFGCYGLDVVCGWVYWLFIGLFVVLLGGIVVGIVVWVLFNGVNLLV